MDITDVIKLVDAGFSKDDIVKLSSANKETKTSNPAPVVEAKKEEPKKEEAPAIADEVNRAVSEAMKPFEDLYGKFSKLAGMPSMGEIKPLGVEDINNNFFEGD